jgi:glutaconyl-CoA decarboxylase
MKYKVTLNGRTYEVEVEAGKAMLLDEYEAIVPTAAPAAPVAAAPVAAPAAAPAPAPCTTRGEG